MIVVSDTTPLSELAKVGRLDILRDTYGEILIDDLAARRVALSRGLPVIGTIGALLLAKQQGRIRSVRELLDALIKGGKWINPQLYTEVLALSGEGKTG
jgi:predicted nucleic acid-binding protein